ncbi:MAG: hypothetical protein OXI38_05575 [Bacteroidota bacterium]|nr:hypothetical protein [Bacteroidota bacterium]
MNTSRRSIGAKKDHLRRFPRPLAILGGLIVLAGVVLVVLNGCGSSNGPDDSPGPPITESEEDSTIMSLEGDTLMLPVEDGEFKRFESDTKYLGTMAIRRSGSVSADRQPESDREQSASEIQFYLDRSRPIGGFVSPSDPDISRFPALIDVAGREMLAVYGAGGIPVRWYGFAEQVRLLPQRPRITRSFFNGSQSELTLALARAQRDLESGATDAAVFLTDLMVTRDGFTSPIHLPNFLAPWIESAGVDDGHFDIAMVGAKLEYWGVQSQTCSASGELGCWFHERSLSWVPLESVVQSPIYFLILSRRTGGDRARELASRIRNALEWHMESDRVHSELLTELMAVRSDSLVIEAQNRPTLQLDTRATNLTLWCVDRSSANLLATSKLPFAGEPSIVSDTELLSGSWDRGKLSVTINCREVRDVDRPVTTGVRIEGPLDEEEWDRSQNKGWKSWQTPDYSSDGTVQLLEALNGLRVASNQVTLDLTRLFTFPDSKD